jgi:hypothetical protein
MPRLKLQSQPEQTRDLLASWQRSEMVVKVSGLASNDGRAGRVS